MKTKTILFTLLAAVVSLSAQGSNQVAEETFWGMDESTVLQDADWKKVVKNCTKWVTNKENSQINPFDQNVQCILEKQGLQVLPESEWISKTYVNNTKLTAGASNGKGTQKQESVQEKASIETAQIQCPVLQETYRKYFQTFRVPCDQVAANADIWVDKVDVCRSKWAEHYEAKSANQFEDSLKQADLQIEFVRLGNKILDCSTK